MHQGPNIGQKRERDNDSEEESGEKRTKLTLQNDAHPWYLSITKATSAAVNYVRTLLLTPEHSVASETSVANASPPPCAISMLNPHKGVLHLIFSYASRENYAVSFATLGGVSHQFREIHSTLLMRQIGIFNQEQKNQVDIKQQNEIQQFISAKSDILLKTGSCSVVKKCFDKLEEAKKWKMNDGCAFWVREKLIEDLNAAMIQARIDLMIKQPSRISDMAFPTFVSKLNHINTTYLDCANLHLTRLPACVLADHIGSSVECIDLRYNKLTVLPAEIGLLVTLKRIYLGHNQLTALPAEIGQLESLHTLGLEYNQLTVIPTEIKEMQLLKYLYLCGNNLTEVPEHLAPILYHDQFKPISLENLMETQRCHQQSMESAQRSKKTHPRKKSRKTTKNIY